MEISNTRNIAPTSMMCLIYSPSAFGKTTLAGTLPIDSTLVISCENGLLSLRDKGMDYIELNPTDRIGHLRSIINFLLTGEKKYKTIFVDGLAELSEAFLKEAEKKFPDKAQTLPRFGEYDKNFRAFLKALRDLKLNVLVTALMKEKKEAGNSCYYPDVIGKISTQLAAMCDFVFSIVIDGKNRMILTQPVDGHICKDRSGKLLVYEEMDLTKIINKIFNQGDLK